MSENHRVPSPALASAPTPVAPVAWRPLAVLRAAWLRAAVVVAVAFALLLVLGNGAILGTSLWVRHTVQPAQAPLRSISNVRVVDAKLWRGAAPGRHGYHALAALIASREANPGQALRSNLAVGPPSLEQIAFAAGLDPRHAKGVGIAVTTVSRILDAPRRLWSRLTAPATAA